MDSEIKWLSENIYWSLCDIVGTEEVIEANRLDSQLVEIGIQITLSKSDKNYFIPLLMNHLRSLNIDISLNLQHVLEVCIPHPKDTSYFCVSGSRAEGFDFQSSDLDVMQILMDSKVVNSVQEIDSFEMYPSTYLKENVRPGFVRLRLPTCHTEAINNNDISLMLKTMYKRNNQGYYLSSSMIKVIGGVISNKAGLALVPHGPCMSKQDETYDHAMALPLHTWPSEALGCVHRLFKHGWPSDDVIKEMVNDGCLFVPIGCKASQDEDIEWRMSFSLAEKRLVLSMNNTQFLTYGLLKLFLKEVIEKETSVCGLLCSYFMKTLVFWEIMDTGIPWSPSFLLHHFWNCFRRLLCWVKNGYCPNFFIPENNMFDGKIQGRNRKALQNYLCKLYREGYFMPLKINSIRYEVDKWVHVPRQCTNAGFNKSRVIQKILQNRILILQEKDLLDRLEMSHSDIVLELSHYFRLCKMNEECNNRLSKQTSCSNRIKYKNEKALFRLLKASSSDRNRSKILLAAHFYARERYEQCVGVLKKMIRNIRTLHTWDFDVNKYSSLGGDSMSVSSGLYRHTTSLVPLDMVSCITEISEECNITLNGIIPYLVTPLVLKKVLLFLCSFWIGNITLACQHLKDLGYFIQHSSHCHIPSLTLPISWEILGRCQEIFGDFRNALISFEHCERSVASDEVFYFKSLLEINEKRKKTDIYIFQHEIRSNKY